MIKRAMLRGGNDLHRRAPGATALVNGRMREELSWPVTKKGNHPELCFADKGNDKLNVVKERRCYEKKSVCFFAGAVHGNLAFADLGACSRYGKQKSQSGIG